MKKYDVYDEYDEQFDMGLILATEEEQKICEAKLKSIGALPEGFVKIGKVKGMEKYYRIVKLNEEQLEKKIKSENTRRLRQIDRHSVTQIVLQSVTLGFSAIIAICAVVALFLIK